MEKEIQNNQIDDLDCIEERRCLERGRYQYHIQEVKIIYIQAYSAFESPTITSPRRGGQEYPKRDSINQYGVPTTFLII